MGYVGGLHFKMFLATSVAHMSVSHIKDTAQITSNNIRKTTVIAYRYDLDAKLD